MTRQEELTQAIRYCCGEVPREWTPRIPDVTLLLTSSLPPMSVGYPMPFVTYLLFQFSRNSASRMVYLNAVCSEEALGTFNAAAVTFKQTAEVEAVLDERNFKAEFDAFGNVEEALTKPHLDISPLYKYLAAVQQSFSFLLDETLYNAAKKAILVNPYRWFAYGEANQAYMPMRFEEVYGGFK